LSSLFGPIQWYMHGTPQCIVCCIQYAPPMHDTGYLVHPFFTFKKFMLCCYMLLGPTSMV